jgi:excisionase family DNA binding protein
MKEWLSIKELSEYLGIPENKINSLIKRKGIPFSDRLGDPRFNKTDIDEWMRTATSEDIESKLSGDIAHIREAFTYRGKSITDYQLTASLVLIGSTPWRRLPDFVKKTVSRVNEIGRPYLYHEEFEPFMTNYNDYLRVSCQLGLIENVREDERKKHYYPTEFALKMKSEEEEGIKDLIRDSILEIVHRHMETIPSERYAILLLWYILKIKEQSLDPEEDYFRLSSDKANNHYPSIRLGFASSLCDFLFDRDKIKEREFLAKWKKLL